MNLDALVAPLRADVVSGAAVVARTAAEVVRRAAGRYGEGSPSDFRQMLVTLSVRILEAQPAMAPLVHLTGEVLSAVEESGSVAEARDAVLTAAERFREGLDRREGEVARAAAELVEADATVLTLSSSSTVRAALLEVARLRPLRVICLESRPMSEGRAAAESLARAGVSIRYAVDAAADLMVGESDLVLVGADSVGDRGIVNKVGTRTVAQAARRRGVPLYVATDTTKLLPPGFPQPTDDDRPAEEVWRAPAGIRVWNRYFEAVELELAVALACDRGVLAPAEVEDARRRIRVPAELRAWAGSRGSGGGTAPPGNG